MIWIKLSRKNNNYFHACCGFTLFEFGVVAIIVGVLGAVLLGRLALYQQQAESAAAERVVGTLHTALTLRTAALIVANREHELPKMSDENPMDWLVEKPKNYLGEFYSSQIK